MQTLGLRRDLACPPGRCARAILGPMADFSQGKEATLDRYKTAKEAFSAALDAVLAGGLVVVGGLPPEFANATAAAATGTFCFQLLQYLRTIQRGVTKADLGRISEQQQAFEQALAEASEESEAFARWHQITFSEVRQVLDVAVTELSGVDARVASLEREIGDLEEQVADLLTIRPAEMVWFRALSEAVQASAAPQSVKDALSADVAAAAFVSRPALLEALSACSEAVFEKILVHADAPPGVISGRSAPQALRAADLIRWASPNGPEGLARLVQAYARAALASGSPARQATPRVGATSLPCLPVRSVTGENSRRPQVARVDGSASPFFNFDFSLPDPWVSRDTDACALAGLLAHDGDDAPRVIQIQGIGGSGKSCFVRDLVDKLQTHGLAFDAVLFFSIYHIRDLSSPFTLLLEFILSKLEPEPQSEESKQQRAAELLRERRALLVLDGLECAQTTEDGAWMKERRFADFLEAACNFPRSRVVVTTREPLLGLSGRRGFQEFHMGPWSQAGFEELLSASGVRGTSDQIKRAYTDLGSHPLVLAAFAGMLVDLYDGSLQGASNVIQEIGKLMVRRDGAYDTPQKLQLAKLKRIVSGVTGGLGPVELQCMRTLSALSGQVTDDRYRLLLAGREASESDLREGIARLARLSLIVRGTHSGRPAISAHPMVRQCFYSEMAGEQRLALHGWLSDAFGRTIEKQSPPSDIRELADLDDVIEWFRQSVRANLPGRALNIANEGTLARTLYLGGWYEAESELLEDLAGNLFGEKDTRDAPPAQQVFLALSLGHLKRKLGQPAEARAYFERLLSIASGKQLPLEEYTARVQIAVTEGFLGRFRQCLSSLPSSGFAEESIFDVPRLEWSGFAHVVLGDFPAGYELLREAEQLARDRRDVRHLPPVLTHLGDVLLHFGETEQQRSAARAKYEEALRISLGERYRDYEADARRGLGDYHRAQGDPDMARECYREAAEMAGRIGYRFAATEVQVALARLAEKAGSDGDEHVAAALASARPAGYAVQEGEVLALRARRALCAGKAADDEDVSRLSAIAEETGHVTIIRELQEVLRLRHACFFAERWRVSSNAVDSGSITPVCICNNTIAPVEYCISTIARLERQKPPGVTGRIMATQGQLSAAAGRMYVYPSPSLHLTLLGCTQREPLAEAFTSDRVAAVRAACASVLAGVAPVVMSLRGIGITGNAIMLQAFGHDDRWAEVRHALADAVREIGEVPIIYPEAWVVYLNIARITDASTAKLRALYDVVETLREADFGEVTISEVELVIADGVASQSNLRVLDTFTLASSATQSAR